MSTPFYGRQRLAGYKDIGCVHSLSTYKLTNYGHNDSAIHDISSTEGSMGRRLNERRDFLLRHKRPCNGVRSSPLPRQQGCESPSSMIPGAITETGNKVTLVTSNLMIMKNSS